MSMEEIRNRARIHQARLSWAAVWLLAILCGVLAVLQYRWVGEISQAERQRLKEDLTSRLTLVRRNFNQEIENSAHALVPSSDEIESQGREAAYAAQFPRWDSSHDRLFTYVALALPAAGAKHDT